MPGPKFAPLNNYSSGIGHLKCVFCDFSFQHLTSNDETVLPLNKYNLEYLSNKSSIKYHKTWQNNCKYVRSFKKILPFRLILHKFDTLFTLPMHSAWLWKRTLFMWIFGRALCEFLDERDTLFVIIRAAPSEYYVSLWLLYDTSHCVNYKTFYFCNNSVIHILCLNTAYAAANYRNIAGMNYVCTVHRTFEDVSNG